MYKYDKTPRFIIVNTMSGEIVGEASISKTIAGIKQILKIK